MMSSGSELAELRELAGLYGVLVEFVDSAGCLRVADDVTLRAVLRTLGAPVEGTGGVAEATANRRHALASRPIEPVIVAWDGQAVTLTVRHPRSDSSRALDCALVREDGTRTEWSVSPKAVDAGNALVARSVAVPGGMPTGDHRLTVRVGDHEFSTLIIAAPSRAFEGSGERAWGIFCPVYALHRASSWGGGDYSDLEALMQWTARQGGGLVATLPMLATCFDDTPWVSPYAPSSRLFGNEFYLDPRRIPAFASSDAAKAIVETDEFRHEVEELRSEPLVHYRRQMNLKRRVLDVLAAEAFAGGCESSPSYRRFLSENPEAEDYAYFMAAAERLSPHWREWPEGFRGLDRRVDVDHAAKCYHLYVQWQLDERLRSLAETAAREGLTWYVDYTVGVAAASYDVWRRREIFALNASVGCPPDHQREDGYAYLIASLRSHLRHAGALRIDHVMGLNRLYWIPRELDGGRGCYVTYPADEIYAILSVESHRQRAWVVGENLGTVPPDVPVMMDRHAVRGVYVIQHELSTNDQTDPPISEVPEASVASMNTHDMPPFAAYWDGRDIEQRVSLGLLDAPTAERERQARPAQREALVAYFRRLGLLGKSDDTAEILRACRDFLASSPGRVTLLNIEDLWLETEGQNVPGTTSQYPNWRRKLRLSFEDIAESPEIIEALRRVDELTRDRPRRWPTVEG
jgi:4-alpha-glucanotransferase